MTKNEKRLFILISLTILGVVAVLLYNPSWKEKELQFFSRPYAAFSFNSETLNFSKNLADEIFLSKVQCPEPDRTTLVLVGNSVAAGTGSVFKENLNRKLAKVYYLINASVNAYGFDVSISLAYLAIRKLAEQKCQSPIHLSIVYPITRTYVLGGLGTLANGLGLLNDHSEFFNEVTNNSVPSDFEEFKSNFRNQFIRLSKCLISSNVTQDWIRAGGLDCRHPFDDEESSPLWLKQYYVGRRDGGDNVMNLVSWVLDDETRDQIIGIVRNRIELLKVQTQKLGLRVSYSYIISPESQGTYLNIKSLVGNAYDESVNLFGEKMNSTLATLRMTPGSDEFYYDDSHLNEKGIDRLVVAINLALSLSKNWPSNLTYQEGLKPIAHK
jgi:hypothetical protein